MESEIEKTVGIVTLRPVKNGNPRLRQELELVASGGELPDPRLLKRSPGSSSRYAVIAFLMISSSINPVNLGSSETTVNT
jgi:hypothetical protein